MLKVNVDNENNISFESDIEAFGDLVQHIHAAIELGLCVVDNMSDSEGQRRSLYRSIEEMCNKTFTFHEPRELKDIEKKSSINIEPFVEEV